MSEQLYERARKHGLSHERSLDAVAAGTLICWCGSTRVCDGGAQRFVGCPVNRERFLADTASAASGEGRETT